MSIFRIAQINIARMLAPIDDEVMADFVAQLLPINALAEQSPGFVWRLQSESGDATSIKVYDDNMIIINLTVWQNADALREFIYKSAHYGVLRERKRWFEKFDGLIMHCGGFLLVIYRVPRRVRIDWNTCDNMANLIVLSPSKKSFLRPWRKCEIKKRAQQRIYGTPETGGSISSKEHSEW